jgi:hypothetical protein
LRIGADRGAERSYRRRRDVRRPRALCFERQEDVAIARIPVVKILRVGLVEDIEETNPELEDLRL